MRFDALPVKGVAFTSPLIAHKAIALATFSHTGIFNSIAGFTNSTL
jgi:hypothetical protein